MFSFVFCLFFERILFHFPFPVRTETKCKVTESFLILHCILTIHTSGLHLLPWIKPNTREISLNTTPIPAHHSFVWSTMHFILPSNIPTTTHEVKTAVLVIIAKKENTWTQADQQCGEQHGGYHASGRFICAGADVNGNVMNQSFGSVQHFLDGVWKRYHSSMFRQFLFFSMDILCLFMLRYLLIPTVSMQCESISLWVPPSQCLKIYRSEFWFKRDEQ